MIRLKYFSDLMLIFLSLPVTLPVFLFISIVVFFKSDSKVFFKQDRPGLNGKIFSIYKFITMTNEIDNNGELKSDTDRLTKFGKFLR